MDEKDIEIFRSLIKTGNVTKSSEKLYTTQSSLTKRIQKMEEELGCQLFIRTKKGVLPTPAAEKILPDFNHIQETLDRIRNFTQSAEGTIAGSLRLGVSVNYARYRLPTVLKHYMEKYPAVDVDVRTDQSTNLYRKLSNNELNIAIVRGEFRWDEGAYLLSEEPVCLVVSRENAHTPLSELPSIQRHSDPSFEESARLWRAEHHIEKSHSSLHINDISTCLAMVKSGIGWAILPEICLDGFDGVRTPLVLQDGTRITRKTYVLYKHDYYELPQVKLFIDEIRKDAERHLSPLP